ncbi:hypothetical protein GCM10027355_28390 [Haloplanus salinarum]|jgi:hypothetical protein
MSPECAENVSRTSRTSITVAVALAILGASVLNPRWIGASGADAVLGLTAWFHLVGYAALGAALRPRFRPGWRGAAVAVALATGYGAGIECLQSALAFRTASLVDAAINGTGALLGVAVRDGVERRPGAGRTKR